MKRKVNDWLLRLVRIDSNGNKEIAHVCFYDMTLSQIMEIAETYDKRFASVRVFKFETVL